MFTIVSYIFNQGYEAMPHIELYCIYTKDVKNNYTKLAKLKKEDGK